MILPRRETAEIEVRRVRDGEDRDVRDRVAVEEPLEIRILLSGVGGARATHQVAVTMRTPGDDFELAAGFLHGEGFITERRALRRIRYCTGDEPQEYNIVSVEFAPGCTFAPELLNRNFYTTSSCGVCGKASLEAVEVRGCAPFSPELGDAFEPGLLRSLPDTLRGCQEVFRRTGGIHAAALVQSDGSFTVVREDVGRHNAVDKVVGHEFLAGRLPGGGGLLLVSGRASFEILQKALAAGIPFVAAVGAPSSLAVELARRFGMTLVGFLGQHGFNVYAGGHRVGGAGARSGEYPGEPPAERAEAPA